MLLGQNCEYFMDFRQVWSQARLAGDIYNEHLFATRTYQHALTQRYKTTQRSSATSSSRPVHTAPPLRG